MIDFKTQTEYTQAYGCRLCLHFGPVAIFFGRSRRGIRIELCTPRHWLRISKVGDR